MRGITGRRLATLAAAALTASGLVIGGATTGQASGFGPARAAVPARALVSATAAAPTRAAAPAAQPVADLLRGIACVSLKSCLATGANLNVSAPLAETWNGSAWKTIGVKLPAKVSEGQLGHLTCVSAKFCVAAGYYITGSGAQGTLADLWNGKGWTVTQPPAPTGAATALNATSCVSAKDCVTVGASTVNTANGPAGAALTDVWSGKAWTRKTAPLPTGSIFSGFDGVSCPSAGFCVAVGATASNTANSALIEAWSGKAWSAMKPAKVPSALIDTYLTDVSCTSSKSCVAVGSGATAGGLTSFAETWNGKSWSYTKVTWPKGVSETELIGVACLAASHCVAVGTTGANPQGLGNTGRAAAVSWNGKTWSPLSVPPPAKGKYGIFESVTCQKTFCAAVGQTGPLGSTNGTGLSGFSTGGSWKLVAAK